jgi:hypothetical protein
MEPPLGGEARDLEPLRHFDQIGKGSPRVPHRRLRHEELGAEDVRFALELAVGVMRNVQLTAVRSWVVVAGRTDSNSIGTYAVALDMSRLK